MSKKPANEKNAIKLYNAIFPSRLREVMATKDVTQAMLAAEIGVSRQSVAKYTAGLAQPNIEALQKIAKYLQVSGDYLIGVNKYPSLDHDINNARAFTGLSERTINTMKNLKNSDICYYSEYPGYKAPLSDVLRILFEEGFIEKMLIAFGRFLYHAAKHNNFEQWQYDSIDENEVNIKLLATWQINKEIASLVDGFLDTLLFELDAQSDAEEEDNQP